MRNVSRRELLALGRSSGVHDPDPLVHFASLLVHATAAAEQAVRERIAAMPAAELHSTKTAGKLVVVLESADSRLIADVATELQNLQGVLTVSIVAHLTERASQLDQTNEPTSISAE